MTIAPATKLETHPSLARDPAGNLIAIPDGTCAWRICRETAGRPREVKGPDRSPVRFPLHTSSDDLVELCGAGAYRVYALDELGELLSDEPIARWDLSASTRDLRNASVDPIALRALPSVAAAAPTTDLRFALETMAQMMRTNTDALRLVAESQVDLAKTIATVNRLPRNAQLPPPAYARTPTVEDSEDEFEDDEEGDEGSAAPTNIYDVLLPFSEKAAELAPMLIGMRAPTSATPKTNTAVASDAAGATSDLASRPFEMRELVDLNYAREKGQAKRAAAESPMRSRIMSEPQLLQQIMLIKNALGPEEVNVLLVALRTWPEADQEELLARIKPLPPEQAVEFCREVIKDVRARNAFMPAAKPTAVQ